MRRENNSVIGHTMSGENNSDVQRKEACIAESKKGSSAVKAAQCAIEATRRAVAAHLAMRPFSLLDNIFEGIFLRTSMIVFYDYRLSYLPMHRRNSIVTCHSRGHKLVSNKSEVW
jgi:hypothetical protein